MSTLAFLKSVQNALTLPAPGNQIQLASLLTLDISNVHAAIQNDILDHNLNYELLVSNCNFFEGDWISFDNLIISYLRLCSELDPFNKRISYDLFDDFYSNLQTAFTNHRALILTMTVYSTTSQIVSLAKSLDFEYDFNRKPRLSHLSTIILKIFNSIRSERQDPSLSISQSNNNSSSITGRKLILLFISTMLCRLYFTNNVPMSCANVFSNMHTASIKFNLYPKSQQVEYKYYLGRFYLYKSQILDSYRHLNWAFQNCFMDNNIRLILKYLIPVSMIMGILPKDELLQQYNLYDNYKPIVISIKTGNLKLFTDHLNIISNQQQFEIIGYGEWFRERGLLLLLMDKIPLLILRTLIMKIQRQQKSNSLSYSSIQMGLEFSLLHRIITNSHSNSNSNINESDSTINILESPIPISTSFFGVENIVISLIDQGFMKAKIFSRIKKITVSNTNAWPKIEEVLRARFGVNDKDDWMDN